MLGPLRRIVDLGVGAGMGAEEAKYIQMSNLGSLLLIAANLPYLVLCLTSGWTLVFFELCALVALLPVTVLINARGYHVLASVYFGALLNLHLIFVTVAMGRDASLQLLIFFTAAGVVTLTGRRRPAVVIVGLVAVLAAFQTALALEGALGPLYHLTARQATLLRHFVQYSIFLLVIVNALIGRLGANFAEDRLQGEKRRSEGLLERLREQDAQKTRFYQNVSHELRTPLTLITGPLEGLLAGERGHLEPACRRELEMMSRNTRRLLRLVNQLLDLSRIDALETELRLRNGNLVALVSELVRSFASYAEERGVALSVRSELENPHLRFDRGIVEKIVSNLLSNACKFTPRGRTVSVALSESSEGRVVLISVRDTGVGIGPKQLERIFDRFYQADGSGAQGHEGTGIGLSLVRELVQAHGGTIAVTSAPGEGAEFVVSLPAARAEGREVQTEDVEPPPELSYARLESAGLPPPQASSAGEDGPQGPGGGATILVVDDDPDVRRYMRGGLDRHYRVVEAADGAEGLAKAREHLPNLVISDVMMPGMDGYAFCRALRGEQRLALMPVILVTAKASHEMVLRGLDCGAVDYIVKPFAFDVLLAKIRVLLEREAEQERIALRDGLTGLLTRAAWEHAVERELGRLARTGGFAGLAFLDIDDFKGVNDGHGHQVGDVVLVELAKTVLRQLRSSDLVGRYGGEEFVLLLPDSTAEAAVHSVERVLELFRARAMGEAEVRLSFSAGVVEVSGSSALSLAEYVARADAAMYDAKRRGKGRVCLWSEETPGH